MANYRQLYLIIGVVVLDKLLPQFLLNIFSNDETNKQGHNKSRLQRWDKLRPVLHSK